ncbi:hypothetical protein [Flavobacterium sp. SM2513]|uniref:hypothetical protein n=1 Tax=Flavobacterium sp. SM2513 TaxID=3424766 RepID=UPI003D7FD160
MTEPKEETIESIISYARQNDVFGEILIAKNQETFPVLKKYFDFGYIYVLDKNFNLIDCNLESYGGRCFQDIQSDICNNVKIGTRKFDEKINGEMVMKTLLENSKCITRKDSINFNDYERIYIYTWVKYSKSCINESSIAWLKCLTLDTNNKSLILNVNTDSIKEH